jgi:hypothetical protein
VEIFAIMTNVCGSTRRSRSASAVFALLILVSGCGLGSKPAKFDTAYQAVFLDSGVVFFGKLEGLGTNYPVLSSVFYVQSSTNPETKQISNILVKRGKEWHSPDRMVLNSRHIMFVEPVTAGSTVANLIAQSK